MNSIKQSLKLFFRTITFSPLLLTNSEYTCTIIQITQVGFTKISDNFTTFSTDYDKQDSDSFKVSFLHISKY